MNEQLLMAFHMEAQLSLLASSPEQQLSTTSYLLMLDWVALNHQQIPTTTSLAAANASQLDVFSGYVHIYRHSHEPCFQNAPTTVLH